MLFLVLSLTIISPLLSHYCHCHFFFTYFINFFWETTHQAKSVSALRCDLPNDLERFYIYLFFLISLSSGDKGEVCLTVSYCVCVCVRLRVWAQCPSRATVNLCTPVDFPGLFPRFKPPPSPLPPYYHGTMWTLAFNLIFFFSSISDSLSRWTGPPDFFTSQSSSLGGLSPHWMWDEVRGCCAVHKAVSSFATSLC